MHLLLPHDGTSLLTSMGVVGGREQKHLGTKWPQQPRTPHFVDLAVERELRVRGLIATDGERCGGGVGTMSARFAGGTPIHPKLQALPLAHEGHVSPLSQLAPHARVRNVNSTDEPLPFAVPNEQAIAVPIRIAGIDDELKMLLNLLRASPGFEDEIVADDDGRTGTDETFVVGARKRTDKELPTGAVLAYRSACRVERDDRNPSGRWFSRLPPRQRRRGSSSPNRNHVSTRIGKCFLSASGPRGICRTNRSVSVGVVATTFRPAIRAAGPLNPDRLILGQHHRLLVSSVARRYANLDPALEHVRRGVPLLADLDTELRAQVSDDGGGSADEEQRITG